MVPTALNFLRNLFRGGRSKDQEQHDQRQTNEEQDLRNTGSGTCDTTKAENRGKQCDHGKDQSPFKHPRFPSLAQSRTRGGSSENPLATGFAR